MITRRSLIRGIGALLAAPAIVRVGSLMPVKAWAEEMPTMVVEFSTNQSLWIINWGENTIGIVPRLGPKFVLSGPKTQPPIPML